MKSATRIDFTPRERLLVESFRILNSELELRTVIKNALGILTRRFRARAACLLLVDLRDYSLRFHGAVAESPETVHSLPLGNSKFIPGWDSGSRKTIIVDRLERSGEYVALISDSLGIIPNQIVNIPLQAGGEFLGMIQIINGGKGSSSIDLDLDLLEIIAERVALTLRNAWILEEAMRATDETRSLYEVGKALSASLDLDEVLDSVLDNLRRVIQYEVAIIYLVDPEDESINQIAVRAPDDSAREHLHLKIGQGICGRVAQTGQAVIVSDVSASKDYIAFRTETKSEMAVPIKIEDRVAGVFNVESDIPGAYSKRDLELMTAFASLAAVTVERARLHKERLAARQIEDELVIARRIQSTFLPSGAPRITGFDVAGINIPSKAVGGDYFDFIRIVEDQHGIAIGDVSGKGIPASLIMAAFRASLITEIRNNFAIRVILEKVNALLYESIESDKFVTAVYGVLDAGNKVFTFSNAGHNIPILRRVTGQVEHLTEGGPALGAFPKSAYEERRISLSTGDILVFYTDGVTEVLDEDGNEFGEKGLLETLEKAKHLSSKEIIDSIVDQTEAHRAPLSETDDWTMIIVKAL
jgi:sigma-B regulation protein RsbU (phosphoserine phosphatase)